MGNLCSDGPSGVDGDMQHHANINVAEFLSVCIYLSEECGKVIR